VLDEECGVIMASVISGDREQTLGNSLEDVNVEKKRPQIDSIFRLYTTVAGPVATGAAAGTAALFSL